MKKHRYSLYAEFYALAMGVKEKRITPSEAAKELRKIAQERKKPVRDYIEREFSHIRRRIITIEEALQKIFPCRSSS